MTESEAIHPEPRKRAINLRITDDLIRDARAQGINLSRFLELNLRDFLKKSRESDWLAENREAVGQYNQRVAEQGSFGDRFRRF